VQGYTRKGQTAARWRGQGRQRLITGAFLNNRSCADRKQHILNQQQCRQHDRVHNLRQVVARWRWGIGIQRPFAKIADEQRQWLYHQLLHPRHHLAVKNTYRRGMQCDTPHEEQHQGTQKHTPCDMHRWMTEKNQSHRAIGRIPVSVLNLHYDFAAKTHRRDAGRAENFKNERYVRRSMMRWNDSLWHLPLRTLHRCGDMPFLQWTPYIHASTRTNRALHR
jgi:hypothetical protein